MKYGISILTATLLLSATPDAGAHNLVAVNGKVQQHQHVYRRQAYGKPLQQGHRIQSANGAGVVVWGSDTRPAYGESTIPRSGPIIDGQKSSPGAKANGKSRYGSAVSNYGKPVSGYGKAVTGYGKPVRNQ